MILEIVNWTIKQGQEVQFEGGFEQAKQYLMGASGYVSHQFTRCIEQPNKYTLLVYWEALEDHTEGFQQSENYPKYRALISDYWEPGTTLNHYEILEG